MYYCSNCGFEFSNPKNVYESHNLSSPPYENTSVCPVCNSTAFYEKNSTHCRCCGAKLKSGTFEYCSKECEKKGKLLWQKQRKKRLVAQTSPLGVIIKDIELYNKNNNKKYSYGQYVALVESKVKKSKCSKKKRNT